MNWDIIDPITTIRLWTVDGSDWYRGRFKSFWLKRNALKCVEEFKHIYLFVDLKNEWTGKSIRVRDNPDKVRNVVIVPDGWGDHNFGG